jgi:WD40 repeat protein
VPSAECVALSYRGERVAAAMGQQVVIQDATTSAVLGRFSPRHGSANALAFSPDSRQLAIATGDNVTILDTASGDEREMIGALGPWPRIVASPHRPYYAVASSYGIRLWHISGKAGAVLDWNGRISGLVLGTDGWLAVAGRSKMVVFSIPQGQQLRAFYTPNQDDIEELVCAPDSTLIAMRTESGNLIVVDPQQDHPRVITSFAEDTVDVMAVSPDSRWLATGGQSLSVRRLANGSLMTAHPMNRRVKTLAWTPDSTGILAGGDGGVYFLGFEDRPE